MYKIQTMVFDRIVGKWVWKYLKMTEIGDYCFESKVEAQEICEKHYPNSDNDTVKIVEVEEK